MRLIETISMRVRHAAATIGMRAYSVIVGLLGYVDSRPAVWWRRALAQDHSFTNATRRGVGAGMRLRAVWTVVCLACLLVLGGVAASSAAAESLCTDTWVGPSEGAWATASDWSTGMVPSSLDVACIGSGKAVHVSGGGSYAVSVVQGEGTLEILGGSSLELVSAFEVSRIHALEMWSGKITGAGTLEVSGSFAWRDESTLAGAGTFIIAKGATGTLYKPANTGTHTLARAFTNEGTLTENSEASLASVEYGSITNRGSFIVDGYGIATGAKVTTTLVNDGVIDKATSATFKVPINFENEGTVSVEAGEVTMTAGCSSGSKAEWIQAAKTSVDFSGSSCSFTGGVLSGAGELVFSAPVTFNGVDAHNASIASDRSMTIGSGTLTVTHFGLESGEVTGPGNLKISGTFSCAGESKMAGSGTTTLEAGATGEIRDESLYTSHPLTIEKHTLINEGTLTLTGEASSIKALDNSVIKNLGTFNANKEIREPRGYTVASKFINRGAFRKTNDPWGTGETVVNVPFENYGRVQALAGKINIEYPIQVDRKSKYGKRNKSALSSLGCKLADPVNCQTGNFYESQTDIAVGGRGVGLDLARTYNAQAAAASEKGAFGYGWTSSFSAHLTFNAEAHTVSVAQDEGATVTFAEEGGKLVAPAWTLDELTGNGSEGYALTMSNRTVYRFSGAGRLESVTDRNGNKTTLGYNEKGQLATITDPASRAIKLAYNAEGLVESATDPMGHAVKYAYESGGLVSVTLPGQASPRWRFKYDASHRMTSIINALGGETVNTYNSASQVAAQKEPSGTIFKWEYEGFRTKITNESTGSVTLDEYTSEDELAAVTRGYGTEQASTESFIYNERGEPVSRTDGNGHTTTYEYSAAGDKTVETDPEGHETKWAYNAHHQVTSETLPSGETTTIEYDEHGNPVKVSRPAPKEETQETHFEYNAVGEMTAMSDPLARKWIYGYDEAGDRTSETDPEGDKTTWAYNEDSQRTSEVAPAGNVEGGEPSKYTTSIERNALGQAVKMVQPEGQETLYEYNADGDQTAVTDPNAHKTTTTYNLEDLATKVTQPSGATAETEYNGAGLVVAQIDGNKHTTKYVRNVLGEVTEIINPLEHKTKEAYDAAGNLLKLTDAAGRTTTYTYNKENEPTKVSYSDGVTPTVEYAYNANGQRTSMVDGTGTTSYTLDQLGRITETKDGHSDTVGYAYNLAGQVTSITYPHGKIVKDGYDKAGRLSSVTDWLSHTIGFSYNPDSQPITTSFPEASGESDHYAYNRTGQQTEAKMSKGTETLAQVAYIRDLNGQVTKATQTGLPGEEATGYAYTKNEQLEKAGSTGYEYDPAGNPTKIGATTGMFNAADELTKAGSTTYAYNEVGQRTKATPETGPANTYGYDQAGNLTTVSRPEAGETPKIEDSYTYDGAGLRASETINGTTKHLTWQLTGLPLLLNDATNSYIYGPEGLPVEQINAEEHATYLHHDQQGSTRLITSEAGSVQGAYTYGAYGETTGHTGTATTPLGYDGQYTSLDTGLIYLRARVYDPSTAQLLSVDPAVEVTQTPYSYAKDNPTTNADRSGLSAEEIELPCLWCAPPLPPAVEKAIEKGIEEGAKAIISLATEETNDEGEQSLQELDCQPNPGALEKIKARELERILKGHGTNAHRDKRETVGDEGGAYDYYRDKETGEIYLVPKAGGEAIPTGYGR